MLRRYGAMSRSTSSTARATVGSRSRFDVPGGGRAGLLARRRSGARPVPRDGHASRHSRSRLVWGSVSSPAGGPARGMLAAARVEAARLLATCRRHRAERAQACRRRPSAAGLPARRRVRCSAISTGPARPPQAVMVLVPGAVPGARTTPPGDVCQTLSRPLCGLVPEIRACAVNGLARPTRGPIGAAIALSAAAASPASAARSASARSPMPPARRCWRRSTRPTGRYRSASCDSDRRLL